MTRKHAIAAAATVAALLLIGSGCESSDIQDVMEIFGGSQGINVVDVAEHAAGNSTGDKDKDTLLDTADTMQKVKEAGELETAANEALGKKPADYKTAQANLEDALKLRPNDWALQEQLNAVIAETGGSAKKLTSFPFPTKLCKIADFDHPSPKEQSCFKAVIADRSAAIEASIARQKASNGLVACATYRELEDVYEQAVRFTPAELIMGYHYSQDDWSRMSDRYDHANAMLKHPGQSCDNRPKPSA